MTKMNRMRRVALLTRLIEELRTKTPWCGETHIQKAVYFAQHLTSVPMGYDFILYKHGPFSFDLRDELTALRADGLLRLEPKWPYGAEIKPTEQSKYIQGLFRNTVRKYKGEVKFIAAELGGKGVVELERLSTALFVERNMESKSVLERAAQVVNLKPHVSPQESLEAVYEVERISKRESSKLYSRVN